VLFVGEHLGHRHLRFDVVIPLRVSMPAIRRRPFKSPIKSPAKSAGAIISTFMIGSRIVGRARSSRP
jgi:hypothetical protein